MPRHLTPRRLGPDDDLAPVLALIHAAFAPMAGLVDPPSSAAALDAAALGAMARDAELWVMEDDGAPVAAMILSPRPGCLHVGKLAVAADRRGEGHARRMIDHAARRARALGLGQLELQARVELAGNHAAFRALGFVEAGRTAHPGYDRPTSITFRRPV
ncbi:MAG: GNAT family N-acetyltransferase [Rhodobacteraceae bacterium]|nr:GNAT family N-acetyltransferase [Paracoccaceae bacterium]